MNVFLIVVAVALAVACAVVVTLLGIVDVEQVIMSIDRFDLLPQTA